MSQPYYMGFAAQMAFYMLLSVVPMILLLSQFLGLFSISFEYFEEWANSQMKTEGAKAMFDILETGRSTAPFNFAFLLLALWSASKAIFSFAHFSDYTFSEGKYVGKSWAHNRLRSIFTIIVVLVMIGIALVAVIYGDILIQFLIGVIAEKITLARKLLVLQAWLRWPAAFLIYLFLVCWVYYVAPSYRVPFKMIIPGAIFASVSMLVITWAFVTFNQILDGYNIIYGSIASFVGLMFWFFFISSAMGLGVVLNKAWADTEEYWKK